MKWIKRLLPLAGSLALLVFLLWQVHPRQILALILRAQSGWLLLGLLCYLLTNIVRSYRTAALFGVTGPTRPLRLLPDMFLVSLFNNTLPSRSGELSFPYLMRQRHGFALGESAAALVLMRIFDYLAVALMFLIAAALAAHRLAAASFRVVGVTFVFLLFTGACLAVMPWLGGSVVGWLESWLKRINLAGRRPVAWLLHAGHQAVAALARMRSLRLTSFVALTSVLGWLGTFAWFAAFMQAVGQGQTLLLVVVGATFATLAKAIPLISIGGLGAHEAGWTLGFGLIGVPAADAIASGFAVNVLTLIASAICGGAAFLYVTLAGRRARCAPTGLSSVAPDESALLTEVK